jgi:hypothetical protein
MTFRTALAGAAALILTLGLVAVPAAAATTRTVCASGCDHTTIAAAVAAASAGDTILVTEDLTVSAATSVNKDATITGADGVTITRTGTSAATFNLTSAADGATISDLTITSATVVGGAFLNIPKGADGVTIAGNTIFGPPQAGPMSGWVTNRAWVSGAVTGLTITGNTFHSLRTGGYIDDGAGTITGNVSYDTKGDYLLSGQSDFTFSGNVAGDPAHKSEWGIVIFAANEVPYDVPALGAANDCLTVWDQGTGATFVDGDCNGVNDTPPPADKDACKQGGWATFDNPSFRNQGQCVSSVATRR